jgi:FdhE protein
LERLREWEQREGQLPGFIKLYRELLNIQSEAKSRITITKPSLVKSSVPKRLCYGIPLLSLKDFSPDWNEVRRVFEQIVLWVAKNSEDLSSGEIESLRNIAYNSSVLKKGVRAWYQTHSLTPIARAQGIDVELLSSVVGAALKPVLFAYARLLLPEMDQELWRRGYCPICGGNPDFAFLDKERGARWLLCDRCDTEWLFQRLECPYCGNQNQAALSYFTDDEGVYRLYVCERCRKYIKTIDLRRTESEVLLLLERVLTLDMDKQAQEKGYKPDHSGSVIYMAGG